MTAKALLLAAACLLGCKSRPLSAGGTGVLMPDASAGDASAGDASVRDASTGDAASSNVTWSAWPLVNHDPANTRRSPNVGPQDPVTRFTLDIGLQMVIGVDGTLYATQFGTGNPIAAFDPATGARLWSFVPTPSVPTTAPPSSPSIAAGPDGNLYAAYRQGPFCALNRDGSLRWQFTTGKTLPSGDGSAFGPPLVDRQGRVYVGESRVVYAFESDGRPAWRFDAPSIQAVTPVALGADGTVYVKEDYGALYALGRDGVLRWTLPVSTSLPAVGGPIVRSDGTLLLALLGERQFGVVDSQGAIVWRKPGSFVFALGADDAPYAADGFRGVVRLDRAGSVVWQAAAGGRNLLVDGAGTVYTTATASIAAVDASGVLKWELSTADPAVPATASVTPSVLAIGGDGTLYAGLNGQIRAIGGGGRCEGKPVDCDDRDPCTVDGCEPLAGCTHAPKCVSPGACTTARCGSDGTCAFAAVPDGVACDDGIACSQGDACRAGQCLPAVSGCAPAGAWPTPAHDAGHTHATTLRGPSALTWLRTSLGVRAYTFSIAGDGTIYTADGELVRWISPSGPTFVHAALPAIELVLRQDDGLYATTSAGELHALGAGGTPQWSFAPASSSAPAVGPSGAIYATTRYDLTALAPDGSTLWRLRTGGAVGAPAVGPDGTVYALCPDLWSIAPDGRVKWKRPVGWANSGMVVGPTGTVFVLLDGGVRAIDANGRDAWAWTLGAPATFGPALSAGGDLILTAGPTIYRLDAATGALRSSLTPPAPADRRQEVTAPIIDGDDVLYVVGNATDNTFQPLTQATVYAIDRSDRVLWTVPYPPAMNARGANLAIGPSQTLYLTINGALEAIGR